MPGLIVECVPVGMLQCNCVIIGDPQSRRALVVDPGDEIERISLVLERHSLTVAAIAATHAHIDHVGGLATLKRLTGAPACMHEEDVPLYERMGEQAEFLGVPEPGVTSIDRLLDDGASIDFGAGAARVIHTPGHSPGSISFAVDRQRPLILSGDSLFAGSIGRTDLWGGSFEELMSSIRAKLLTFGDDAIVMPGHGPQTTIGIERRTNPFLV